MYNDIQWYYLKNDEYTLMPRYVGLQRHEQRHILCAKINCDIDRSRGGAQKAAKETKMEAGYRVFHVTVLSKDYNVT